MRVLNLLRVLTAAALFAAIPTQAIAQVYVGIGIGIAPPPIPTYVQPPNVEPNYIWVPGYWAWGPGGYYWVPGTWEAAPAVGMLWTPGYWAWNSGSYYWNAGFWGPNVGFYGGVNYGFGYFGIGYVGGQWAGNVFRYNTAVTNVNTTIIRNVYVDKTVVNKYTYSHSRVSYNGGPNGIKLRPTQAEIALRQKGAPQTAVQRQHEQMASTDRNHLATVNHGTPTRPATVHPYSESNRPVHPAPITNDDRAAAQKLVVHPAPPKKPPS